MLNMPTRFLSLIDERVPLFVSPLIPIDGRLPLVCDMPLIDAPPLSKLELLSLVVLRSSNGMSSGGRNPDL